jgi:hypothetical protein
VLIGALQCQDIWEIQRCSLNRDKDLVSPRHRLGVIHYKRQMFRSTELSGNNRAHESSFLCTGGWRADRQPRFIDKPVIH